MFSLKNGCFHAKYSASGIAAIVMRLVVAGGKTSGAISEGLALEMLEIGPGIALSILALSEDAMVPRMRPDGTDQRLHLGHV